MIDHTPRLLSEADADLAGLPRPTEADQALPRPVSSEDVLALANKLAMMCDVDYDNVTRPATIMLRTLVSERDALAGRVRGLEAERDAAAKRPDFAEFVDETDSTLEMVKRTFGNRSAEPKMLEAFATMTMIEQLLKQCEQVRAALSTTPESKP